MHMFINNTYTHTYTFQTYIHICSHIYTIRAFAYHKCIHNHIHIYTHMHTYINIPHTSTNTHTHTYAHSNSLFFFQTPALC